MLSLLQRRLPEKGHLIQQNTGQQHFLSSSDESEFSLMNISILLSSSLRFDGDCPISRIAVIPTINNVAKISKQYFLLIPQRIWGFLVFSAGYTPSYCPITEQLIEGDIMSRKGYQPKYIFGKLNPHYQGGQPAQDKDIKGNVSDVSSDYQASEADIKEVFEYRFHKLEQGLGNVLKSEDAHDIAVRFLEAEDTYLDIDGEKRKEVLGDTIHYIEERDGLNNDLYELAYDSVDSSGKLTDDRNPEDVIYGLVEKYAKEAIENV